MLASLGVDAKAAKSGSGLCLDQTKMKLKNDCIFVRKQHGVYPWKSKRWKFSSIRRVALIYCGSLRHLKYYEELNKRKRTKKLTKKTTGSQGRENRSFIDYTFLLQEFSKKILRLLTVFTRSRKEVLRYAFAQGSFRHHLLRFRFQNVVHQCARTKGRKEIYKSFLLHYVWPTNSVFSFL